MIDPGRRFGKGTNYDVEIDFELNRVVRLVQARAPRRADHGRLLHLPQKAKRVTLPAILFPNALSRVGHALEGEGWVVKERPPGRKPTRC